MPAPDRTAASTFSRVAIDLAHEAFPELASAIRACSGRSITHWRDLSLRAMPHLDALTLKEFEDTIAEILAAAADAFQSADPQQLRGVVEAAPSHGVDRFLQKHSLLDLFEEVRILRGVVIRELAKEMKRPLVPDEAATFHAIFDIIIQQGVMTLVQKQNEHAERLRETTRAVNEELLVASVRQHELTELAERARGAQRQAEEVNARLAAIVESSDDAIISKDLDGIITTWNRGAEHLFGYTAEEAVGKSISLVIPDDHLHEVPSILERIRRGEAIDHYETVRRRKDGQRLDISLTISPLRDAGGRITGASKIARDITERKQAEEALRESEERYRTLFDLGPVAIYSIDSSGVIQNFNRHAANLWGREPACGDSDERFCGSFRMFRPDGTYMPHDQCPMAEVVSGRISEMRDGEVVIERSDGTRVTVIVNIRPLKNARGEVTGAVNCFYDISDRVALERQVRQQAETLAGESRRKDEFLAMLSHELRNPLAPIRSAVHLMRMQERGSENLIQQQARGIIERQVANLTKIVSDLLEVSRVVSGRIRLERQAVDLNRILQHAIETAAPIIEQRKHALKLNLCSEAEGAWVNVDPTRVEEVFINLLNNAAKYTPDGGRIEVWCERPPALNYAQVRVRDNGVGIEKELLPRIFDLFTQADRSLARSAGGLGIGLSLAHRLVDLHGGTIEAHSPPEGETKGSEFIVRLPLMVGPPAIAQPQPPAEDSTKPEGVRVLLVDDNIDLVMMLASTLRHKGYSVQVAYTGPDGLKAAQQWRPDVVLLDIGLPGLDGYEVARRLRADQRLGNTDAKIKLIALTGYGRDSDLAAAREAGFDGHLVKPVEFNNLERMMAAPTTAPRT